MPATDRISSAKTQRLDEYRKGGRRVSAARSLDKPFDLMTYPGGKHGLVRMPEGVTTRWY